MAKSSAKGVGALVTLDRSAGGAAYAQIAEALRRAIDSGVLAPSERLASTRSLAHDWGVSRNTVVQAFDVLLAEGYLVARVGDGTYVSENRPVRDAPAAGKVDGPQPGGYPFRGLSRRGRTLVARPPESLPERPLPFMPDVPDLREFPMRAWLRVMNEVSGGLTGEALAGVSSAGFAPLRSAIAHHVSVTRGLRCNPDQVIVTTGSQQGLDLAVRLLVDRGDPVWIEEPGYVGARAALAANGCNLQLVPVDGEGLDVAAGIETRLVPRMICVSPARQYPTGAVLSPGRRRLLLSFASRAGAWIIEDDYDSETHYAASPPAALGADDPETRVVFIGTFSKTLVPSLRLGYVIAPRDLAGAFAAARAVAQGHAPLLEQMVLAEMMHRGIYAAHVRRMRTLYRSRQLVLATALERELGYRVPAAELRSGMHLVLPLRPDAQDAEIAKCLGEAGVIARPLSPYFAGPARRPGLLLGFAAYASDKLEAAAGRLRPLLAGQLVTDCNRGCQ